MPIETEPFVSIITLNYNQAGVTLEFLESTKKIHYRNYEILVCDMASVIDPLTQIDPSKYHQTRILKSPQNLGFAGGNNWGMRHAGGEFFFIVNNDAEITPDLIQDLMKPFRMDSNIGVTCPKIKYYSNPDVIQYAGFREMNKFTGRTSTIGENERDFGQYDQSGPTNAAHGCAMMVKKEIIRKTGMFPEKFFLYYEEWDWSERIKKAGYTIWYVGHATILHKESMTVGKENPMKVYYHTRNRILLMRRNSDLFHLIIFTLFFAFVSTPKSICYYFAKGQFRQLKFFLKGIWWNIHSTSTSAI